MRFILLTKPNQGFKNASDLTSDYFECILYHLIGWTMYCPFAVGLISALVDLSSITFFAPSALHALIIVGLLTALHSLWCCHL